MAKTFDELASRTMSVQSRERAALRTRQLQAEMLLIELRRTTGQAHRRLAAALGVQPPTAAQVLKQDALSFTALQTLTETLGVELEMLVRVSGVTVRVSRARRSGSRAQERGRARKAA